MTEFSVQEQLDLAANFGDLVAEFVYQRKEREDVFEIELLETLFDFGDDVRGILKSPGAEFGLTGQAVLAHFVYQAKADVDVRFDELNANLGGGAAS